VYDDEVIVGTRYVSMMIRLRQGDDRAEPTFLAAQFYHFSALHHNAVIAVVCPGSHQAPALVEIGPTVVGCVLFVLRVSQA